MTTTSDLICKLIKSKGFTIAEFCRQADIKQRAFYYAMKGNSWTKPVLTKVSKCLGTDLTSLVNATVGNTHVHK